MGSITVQSSTYDQWLNSKKLAVFVIGTAMSVQSQEKRIDFRFIFKGNFDYD